MEFENLVAYWLGELAGAEGEKVEEHYLGCAECAGRLEWIAALSDGVRAAVHRGAVSLAVSRQFVEAMNRAGLRLREYRNAPGGRVECTIKADDDAVISRLQAPLAGVKRLDLVQRLRVGAEEWPEMRFEDVPFDPEAGEFLFVPPPAQLRKLPAHVATMRLVAVGENGDAVLGEYTFSHTPS